jgi:hypothetical protein
MFVGDEAFVSENLLWPSALRNLVNEKRIFNCLVLKALKFVDKPGGFGHGRD